MKSLARPSWSFITRRSRSAEWCWHRSSPESGNSNSSSVTRDVWLTSVINHGGTSPLNRIWMKPEADERRGYRKGEEGWGEAQRASPARRGGRGRGGLGGDYRGNDRLGLLVVVTQTTVWIQKSVAQWKPRRIGPVNAAQMLSSRLLSSSFKHFCHLLHFFFSSYFHRKTRTSGLGCMLTDEVSEAGDSFHFALKKKYSKDGFKLEPSINCSSSWYIGIRNTRVCCNTFQIFWNTNMRTSMRIRRDKRMLGLRPDVTDHENLTWFISINCCR